MTHLTCVLQTPEANWVTWHNNPVTPARTIKKGPCASWIFHQVWHIEIWKVAGVVLVGKASDIRTQAWTHTDTHTHNLVSTDELWENKQLQEEEWAIRLEGLPNFIIYYGLHEKLARLWAGLCFWNTCNCKSMLNTKTLATNIQPE